MFWVLSVRQIEIAVEKSSQAAYDVITEEVVDQSEQNKSSITDYRS